MVERWVRVCWIVGRRDERKRGNEAMSWDADGGFCQTRRSGRMGFIWGKREWPEARNEEMGRALWLSVWGEGGLAGRTTGGKSCFLRATAISAALLCRLVIRAICTNGFGCSARLVKQVGRRGQEWRGLVREGVSRFEWC